MRALNHIFENPYNILMYVTKKYAKFIPEKISLKIIFRGRMGYWPDLQKPKTFSEKMQWLKLYDRKREYTIMVDKYAAKEYVAGIIGDEYIIPTIGVWDNANDIDFEKLPDRFVLKCTHDSGGLVICRDKNKLEFDAVRIKLNKILKQDYSLGKCEWPYKKVPRRIIAEQYIDPDPETGDLPDYKFFCFNGEPKYCQVITGRNTEMCIDFFDCNWNHQPFHEPKIYPFANPTPKRPAQYSKMWKLARQLAANKPFSRIDFYNIGDIIYFGEITFFPTSGMGGFDPEEYDEIMGKMIELPFEENINLKQV